MHCAEGIEVTLHACCALDGCRDVRLPAEPRDQSLGECVVVGDQRSAIGPQDRGEGWGGAGDLGEAVFHQRLGGGGEGLAICSIDVALGDDILFESVEPGVHRRPQCPLWRVRCGEPLDKAAVHLLPAMQWRLGLRDLHFAGGKARDPRSLLQPAAEEGFSAPIFAAHGLESASAGGHCGKIGVDSDLEALHTDRESGQPLAGYCAPAKGVEDSATTLWTGHDDPSSSNWRRSSVSFRTTSSPSIARTCAWSTLRTRRAAFTSPPIRKTGAESA
jgi:hypothetical protein